MSSTKNPSSIGIMDGAFFVGRRELLAWLNSLLGLNYSKVEQCASGAAHCQILDTIYPGKIPLQKVNFNATLEYEFVKNYKVLQTAFAKLGIDKHIPVDLLVKGKYQDNLEFLQWMKRFHDINFGGDNEDYDAASRRQETVAAKAPPKPKTAKTTPPATTSKNEHVNQLKEENEKLRTTIEGLEKERDFYFGKLRDIEIMCHSVEDKENPFVQAIVAVLYKVDDSGDFVTVDEEEA
eukprot:GCRY01001569.1.p1 GENE.GCRY01001569.1~~GCRY01001569.1.p1  ORF type:complete len:236 (+),score=27.98 GCRY01001569.1:167-874(+)